MPGNVQKNDCLAGGQKKFLAVFFQTAAPLKSRKKSLNGTFFDGRF